MWIADIAGLALVLLVAIGAGAAATAFSMTLARRLNILAVPDARSSHQISTPRLGGFGYFIPLTIVLIAVVVWPVLLYAPARVIQPALGTLIRLGLICGSLAFVIGLMDDFLHLPPWFKLLGQIACAGLFLYLGSRIEYTMETGYVLLEPGATVAKAGDVFRGAGFGQIALTQGLVLDGPSLAAIVTLLWIVTVMNAYNFMDGIDGLAGVFAIAVVVGLFAVYAGEAHQNTLGLTMHVLVIGVLSVLLVGVSVGFLFYNWPPASTFLGDCGSQYIGFILAAVLAQATRLAGEPALDLHGEPLLVAITKRAYVDFLAVVILVFPFLYDVSYTLIRRLAHGKPVWHAHHEHLYQRLIDLGWSHRRVVLFSLPFYLAHAAIFYAYCWAPSDQMRLVWAAVALAPMLIYTAVVIASERRGRMKAEG